MKYRRKLTRFAICVATIGMMSEGCFMQNDIVKRFREGYEPGFVSGVTSAITDPDNAETGIRQAISAVFDGLGAVVNPRTPSSASGG